MDNGMDFKLRVFDHCFPADRYNWELTGRGLYICSDKGYDDGYTTKQGARRAGLRAAHKLGLTVIEEDICG